MLNQGLLGDQHARARYTHTHTRPPAHTHTRLPPHLVVWSGDVKGYVHVMSNCVTSALYLRAVTSVKQSTGASTCSPVCFALYPAPTPALYPAPPCAKARTCS